MLSLCGSANAESLTPSVINESEATACDVDLEFDDHFGEIDAFVDNLDEILGI